MTQTSNLSRNFPTLQCLAVPFRWVFRSRRRVVIATSLLLAILLAPPLWWSIQLMGLPDVGDPYDVEAFRSFTIPDESNAFVLYREAADRLKPWVEPGNPKDRRIDRRFPLSKADPTVRRWVEDNREAMEIYRRGTERPDALAPSEPLTVRSYEVLKALGAFQELAFLEASRLEGQGDMMGAWAWYRAALRAAYHVGQHATTFERGFAQRWQVEVQRRAGSWAADPRTSPAMLRRALDDAIACEALRPSDSYTIKMSYQFACKVLMRLDTPGRHQLIFDLKTVHIGSSQYQLDPDLVRAIADAWRSWRREPERSLRVIRLAIANWLAHEDAPPDRRSGPDPDISGPYDFYAFGPEAPAGARALSPRALDRWLTTAADAQILLRSWDLRAVRIRERVTHWGFVVLLASQLYRRDHGTDPPSEQSLVGPYLKELPDDGYGDAGGAKDGGGSAGPEGIR